MHLLITYLGSAIATIGFIAVIKLCLPERDRVTLARLSGDPSTFEGSRHHQRWE
jgi:hypothetical protein